MPWKMMMMILHTFDQKTITRNTLERSNKVIGHTHAIRIATCKRFLFDLDKEDIVTRPTNGLEIGLIMNGIF